MAKQTLASDIEKRLKSKEYYTSEQILHVMKQCVIGLDHMHKYKIYHRDIKPENILIMDDNLNIKISDFGASKCLKNDNFQSKLKHTLVGTPVFLSPLLMQELSENN